MKAVSTGVQLYVVHLMTNGIVSGTGQTASVTSTGQCEICITGTGSFPLMAWFHVQFIAGNALQFYGYSICVS